MKIKIGITTRKEMGVWSNGLDQNIFFLQEMLEEIGYDSILITEEEDGRFLFGKKVVKIDLDSVKNFDIILEVAHPLSDNLTNYFNSLGRPLIGIKYGNSFMLDLEGFISKNKSGLSTGVNLPYRNREIWVSDQFYKFKDYYEVLCRAPVKVIPYIWDPSLLMANDEGLHLQPMRVERENLKKIAIVEPNLNIIKNCMIPLAICEMAYDKNSELIKEVLCFGSKHMNENRVFMNYIKNLNIHKNKISSYEARYPIYKMFKNNLANTIVTTQLLNEQNYVYFEALFYKRNLVHNSPYFKDVGYYYPEYNVNLGSDKLLESVQNFDQEKHAESYEEKLFEHSIFNPKNQEKTKELIESVL
jgi:hypothetical protein